MTVWGGARPGVLVPRSQGSLQDLSRLCVVSGGVACCRRPSWVHGEPSGHPGAQPRPPGGRAAYGHIQTHTHLSSVPPSPLVHLCAGATFGYIFSVASGIREFLGYFTETLSSRGFLLRNYICPMGCCETTPSHLSSPNKPCKDLAWSTARDLVCLRKHFRV